MNYLLKNSPQRIRENVALFIGMCLFTGINYLGQRFIVFKQKKKNNNEKIGY
jgi:putative flippase GtrA